MTFYFAEHTHTHHTQAHTKTKYLRTLRSNHTGVLWFSLYRTLTYFYFLISYLFNIAMVNKVLITVNSLQAKIINHISYTAILMTLTFSKCINTAYAVILYCCSIHCYHSIQRGHINTLSPISTRVDDMAGKGQGEKLTAAIQSWFTSPVCLLFKLS